MGDKGHPLPESKEARHNEIPESLEEAKGRGDDGRDLVSPDPAPVNPDGETYRYGDLGRGPADQEPPRLGRRSVAKGDSR